MNAVPPSGPPLPAPLPRAYWRRTLRATALLLAVWFAVTFVIAFFARDLQFHVFGWPFSFWVGAQGGLAVYVGITWWYARTMRRLDREHGIGEDGLPLHAAEPQEGMGRPGGGIV
ncbi:MAG TPA: DUF4212 domain-containing protein [Ramlibacter sp.]|uniref:DUF4212 domain-containing protein n=1 Tax=Ramlibacter sp. TaxID=1917967 RepID=UPI002D71C7E3|nr:DUF4212 domain-containing protein [Ramlibacter sp.]HZY19364.1 DUF4212 domain-containing protein [Ramlibacter sp.]